MRATEKAKIQTTHLDNPRNPFCYTTDGNATNDKVFLLGLSDVYGEDSHYSKGSWYFNNETDRKALATWYAVSKGVKSFNDINERCSTTNFDANKCFAVMWLYGRWIMRVATPL